MRKILVSRFVVSIYTDMAQDRQFVSNYGYSLATIILWKIRVICSVTVDEFRFAQVTTVLLLLTSLLLLAPCLLLTPLLLLASVLLILVRDVTLMSAVTGVPSVASNPAIARVRSSAACP